ncbi:MAG: hypothetical protein AAF456_11905, partial [Planctomycetota bacterium]
DDADFMSVIETALAEDGPAVMPEKKEVTIELPNLVSGDAVNEVNAALAAKFSGLLETETSIDELTVKFVYHGDEDVDAVLNSLVEEGSSVFEGWSRK